jgi:hypothetical protein
MPVADRRLRAVLKLGLRLVLKFKLNIRAGPFQRSINFDEARGLQTPNGALGRSLIKADMEPRWRARPEN